MKKKDKNCHSFWPSLYITCKYYISCESLMPFCEFQGKLTTNRPFQDLLEIKGQESCCEALFDPKPLFVHQAGTCYSTKRNHRRTETIPATTSKISLYPWLHPSPGQKVSLSGTHSAEQDNFKWVVTDKDAPGYWLFTKPQKLAPMMSKTVALSMTKTIKHNAGEKCKSKDEEFERIYDMPYTTNNCKLVLSHKYTTNCSIAIMAGIKTTNASLKPCMPQDTIHGPPGGLSAVKVFQRSDECPLDCEVEEYVTSVSTGKINVQPLAEFLRMVLAFSEKLNKPEIVEVVQESIFGEIE